MLVMQGSARCDWQQSGFGDIWDSDELSHHNQYVMYLNDVCVYVCMDACMCCIHVLMCVTTARSGGAAMNFDGSSSFSVPIADSVWQGAWSASVWYDVY
jgi:hypothetical protein